jgi:squalene-hopene/tetraprenyl-beta-curcumene cyclase
LAASGRADHRVAIRGTDFLVRSARADGSWPIDTNLATWVTTLSINALGADVPETDRASLREWLLAQQFRGIHPYTNADPGGWAWTNLPGGVPDADDTSGALLALMRLRSDASSSERPTDECDAIIAGVRWLVDLQNRDGGWPTFCRGWGTLPFDRSAADITAHVIRALSHSPSAAWPAGLRRRVADCIRRGFDHLAKVQRADGSWLPLWFGNQFGPHEENPTYGTSRVLAAFRYAQRLNDSCAARGLAWLRQNQNDDGGWGGVRGAPSTIEETALAVEAVLSADADDPIARRGLGWLLDRVEAGSWSEPAPIGFYFARLWYFEKLYPQIFVAAALRCANHLMQPTLRSAPCPSHRSSLPTPTASPRPQ